MEKEYKYIRMDLNIMENGRTTNSMAKEPFGKLMETSMKDLGPIIRRMVSEAKYRKMDLGTMGIGKTIYKAGLVSKKDRMVPDMQANSKMA